MVSNVGRSTVFRRVVLEGAKKGLVSRVYRVESLRVFFKVCYHFKKLFYTFLISYKRCASCKAIRFKISSVIHIFVRFNSSALYNISEILYK